MRAGEVLVIPPEVEPEVWVLQDTVVLDFFAPTRHDWRERPPQYLKGKQTLGSERAVDPSSSRASAALF